MMISICSFTVLKIWSFAKNDERLLFECSTNFKQSDFYTSAELNLVWLTFETILILTCVR